MKEIFNFGEKVEGFKARVLNEREIRASSGILFLFALIAFIESWIKGNFTMTKIFVIIFMIEFVIRIFINPRYAPSLILGRLFVKNQNPEYVGAPQKKFAWMIGFIFSLVMLINLVFLGSIGPINFLICIACLTFLFFESAFGICIGCKMYNIFYKDKAELCPGGTCEIIEKDEIQKISKTQIFILILFIGFIFTLVNFMTKNTSTNTEQKPAQTTFTDCEVPDWVKKLGHEDKYKLHHEC